MRCMIEPIEYTLLNSSVPHTYSFEKFIDKSMNVSKIDDDDDDDVV